MDNSKYNIQPDLWNIIYNAMQIRCADSYRTTAEFREALANIPIRRQEVKIPKVISEAAEAKKQNPVRKIPAKLFSS